jgi:nucleotide-binding universal stress UspA family protein
MKEIVVAVDLSEISLNALEHAVSLAQKANTGIYMVFSKDNDSKKIPDPEKKLDELIGKYKPLLKDGMIGYQIVKGKIAKQITKIANEKDTYLIMSGSRGATDFEEFLIGSTANKIIAAASQPVITIKLSATINRELSRIILPINSISETRQKIPLTAEIAKLFKAEVYVLGLYSSTSTIIKNNVNNYVNQAAKFLDNHLVKNHVEYMNAPNLTDASIEFAKKVDANLISIMTKQETNTSNLWFGGYPQQMVNHSPVPVLSCHVKEVIRTLS